MKSSTIKLAAAVLLTAAFALPSVLPAGQDAHQHAEPEKKTPGSVNPLIEEMMILDSVFREVVSAVSLGDGMRVHAALEKMHGTMEKTHEGVNAGAVSIPKNKDRVKEFVAMDKEFHGDLEALAHAAHQNDQGKMLSLTKKLLDRCVDCHRDFRK